MMKLILLLSIFFCFLISCTPFNEKKQEQVNIIYHQASKYSNISELSAEQNAAFDALNTLQVNTDHSSQLYSTFPGLEHECYPPETSITLSQDEFQLAMQEFVNRNCKKLTTEERNQLAAASSLAQEEYTVLICFYNSNSKIGSNEGTWIIPSMLGRRDVVIEW